jgi:hypothetical protein
VTSIARKGEFVEVFYDFDHFSIARQRALPKVVDPTKGRVVVGGEYGAD